MTEGDGNGFAERLARIDERTANSASKLTDVARAVEEIRGRLERDYVTQSVLRETEQRILSKTQPVQNLVYGFVSVVLLAVIGAIVGLVIRK